MADDEGGRRIELTIAGVKRVSVAEIEAHPGDYFSAECGTELAGGIKCGDAASDAEGPPIPGLDERLGGIFLGTLVCKECFRRLERYFDGKPTEDA